MTSPAATPPRATASRRVLLVDDDAQFLQLLKEFFLTKRDPSWVVHTAGEYSEVLESLKRHDVDLVVLDIQMPIMDGLQLLKLLRRGHPTLPIVLLSGVVTQEKRDYALQNGATLVLEKLEAVQGFDRIFPALEAAAEPRAEGFKGVMRQVGLIELLQMECLGKKSSVMEIRGPNADGRIYISEGAIVHAECEQEFGKPALAQLLRLKGGEFHLAPFRTPNRKTIDESWEGLLMDAAQASDEQAGDEATQKQQAAQIAAQVERAMDRRLEEIVVVSTSNDILYQWKAKDAERRVRLINLLVLKSTDMSKIIPTLGRGDRFEINEPNSRVICLLRLECRVFIRLSLSPAS
jgi:CheY-like chemotaxis protein